MLNPPLSCLSPQLLESVVDHCAKLPAWWTQVANLGLSDRAFTARCRVHVFREFRMHDGRQTDEAFEGIIRRRWRILNDNPSLARLIGSIHIDVYRPPRTTVLSNSTFMKILKIMEQYPNAGRKIWFERNVSRMDLVNPAGVVIALGHLSPTLTTLHLCGWSNLPLDIFRVCPNLKDVTLEELTSMGDPETTLPSTQAIERKPPAKIERLAYRDAHQIVKLLLHSQESPLGPFVDWSHLRILKASPHEHDDMLLVQPILDTSSETLEEVYLTYWSNWGKQSPLEKLVNLKSLKKLRAIGLFSLIDSKTKNNLILHDLCVVLNTIPDANLVKTIIFNVTILGNRPFKLCVDQDWDGLCREIIRISAKKPLHFHLYTIVRSDGFDEKPGSARVYQIIEDRVRLALSGKSHITFRPLNSISEGQPA